MRHQRDGRMEERAVGDVDGRDERAEGEEHERHRAARADRPRSRRRSQAPTSRSGTRTNRRGMTAKIRMALPRPSRRLRSEGQRPLRQERLQRRLAADAVELAVLGDEEDAAAGRRRRERAEDVELAPQPWRRHDEEAGGAGERRPPADPRAPRPTQQVDCRRPARRARPAGAPSVRDRKARPTTRPPSAKERRSPRSPRAHSHRARLPRSMKRAKLSGWPRYGATAPGMASSRPGAGGLPAGHAGVATDGVGERRHGGGGQPERQRRGQRRSDRGARGRAPARGRPAAASGRSRGWAARPRPAGCRRPPRSSRCSRPRSP